MGEVKNLILILLLSGCAHMDKAQHFGAGAGMCILTKKYVGEPYGILTGILTASAVSFIKESSDPKPSGPDFAATSLGGFVGCISF